MDEGIPITKKEFENILNDKNDFTPISIEHIGSGCRLKYIKHQLGYFGESECGCTCRFCKLYRNLGDDISKIFPPGEVINLGLACRCRHSRSYANCLDDLMHNCWCS
jgi:hypothetical protein